jgi:YbbR domain-containing protein
MPRELYSSKEPTWLILKQLVRKAFLEDWLLKLTALVITLGLWFGVTGLGTPFTKRFTVPLVPSISSNAVITNAVIPDVEIVVSGDKRRVEQIKSADLIAALDLTDVPAGDKVITLSPDTISVPLPQGIRLMEVQPSRIPVNLEAVEEKDLAVEARSTGEPLQGYEVYGWTSLPPRIRVRGPASTVRMLDRVNTEVIDLSGKSADFTVRQVAVGVENGKAAVLNTVVDVIFRIGEKRIERTFNAPVTGETNKTASFTLFGPKTLLSHAKSDDFRVEMGLDDNGLEAPRVVLPDTMQNAVQVRRVSLRP